MFNVNKVTRTFRNAQQQGGGFGASTTTHPFNSAGSNVFEQMKGAKNTNDPSSNNMAAPNMNGQGMPEGVQPPPLESMQVNTAPQWSPNQGQQQGQQQGQYSQQGQQPQGQQQGGSPLDIYNPVSDNNNQGQQGQQQGQQQDQPAKSIFDTDLKGWEGVTGKVDLTAGIEPDKVQLALSGTPESPQAFMEIIQQVSRTAMTQAAFMATKVAGQGVNNSLDSFGKTVPNLINDHQFSTMWQGDSVMSHPSAQPMVNALTQQFRQQHPQATMQEVQDQVKHYMQTFTGAMSGQQQQQAPTENTPDAGTGNVSLTDFFS